MVGSVPRSASPETESFSSTISAASEVAFDRIKGTTDFQEIPGDETSKSKRASGPGWDEHEVYAQRIRNYTTKSISVEVRRSFPGHVVFRSQLEPTLQDHQTPEFRANVGAGETEDLQFEIVRSQGYLSKQSSVTLEAAGSVKQPK